MFRRLTTTLALALLAAPAAAEGVLQLYTWGDYTSPEALKKFEAETGTKVVVTEYDNNDTALAKIEAGGHGFDVVVPSANFVQLFVEKGLVQELDHAKLPSLANIAPRWREVEFDPGRKWSVPYQWGASGVDVNRTLYKGDINTSDILFDPPAELRGKVNLMPEMTDVMGLATANLGVEYCTEDLEALKKVRDKLMAAKPHWIAMDYGSIEKMTSKDFGASMEYNGAALRTREANPDIAFGYPREGYPLFMDNLMILKEAKNPEAAYAYLDFMMKPENAALASAFTKYANAVTGSEAFLPEAMKTAPEVVIPPEAVAAGRFLPRCDGKGLEYMTAIWTELTK